MKYYTTGGTERKERGPCGKVCFDKKGAQTKKNSMKEKGIIFRIYNCPKCNAWHLTKGE